jgi:hypothetical protein
MRRLKHLLLVVLAIVFLVEAWLWRHLGPVVETIVARIPLRRIKAAIAATDGGEATSHLQTSACRPVCSTMLAVSSPGAISAIAMWTPSSASRLANA